MLDLENVARFSAASESVREEADVVPSLLTRVFVWSAVRFMRALQRRGSHDEALAACRASLVHGVWKRGRGCVVCAYPLNGDGPRVLPLWPPVCVALVNSKSKFH